MQIDLNRVEKLKTLKGKKSATFIQTLFNLHAFNSYQTKQGFVLTGYFFQAVFSGINNSQKKIALFNQVSYFISFYRTIYNNSLLFISKLLFNKTIYHQVWKRIVVHFHEKNILLVRSDNNTGLSFLKVLQTTTI